MRRKDLKKIKYEENFFGKKWKKKKIRLNPKICFLRKLSIRRNKTLIRKNLLPNYVFYKNLLINFRKIKSKYIYKLFFKDTNNFVNFFPNFTHTSQFLTIGSKVKKLELSHNTYSFFFFKKLKKISLNIINDSSIENYGLNYYMFNLKNKNNFYKDLLNDENVNLLTLKKDYSLVKSTNYNYINSINWFFNFNIYTLNIVEIYKILIFLYLNKINK